VIPGISKQTGCISPAEMMVLLKANRKIAFNQSKNIMTQIPRLKNDLDYNGLDLIKVPGVGTSAY